MTIEERITRLEDIEAIRYLQAKYQRLLDSRDFDELAKCFTEDAVSSYGNASMSYNGRDAIIRFLCNAMSPKMPSGHFIHGGEIDIIDPNNAKALWYLEDRLNHKKYLVQIHGGAVYHVEYKKIDGNWYISSIGYERTYEYNEMRSLMNIGSLGKTTLIDKVMNADPETLGEYGKYYRSLNEKKKKAKKK